MARYYHTVDKVEVLFVEPPLPPNVVELPPENVFWLDLPEGHELTFGVGDLPVGTQPVVPDPRSALLDALYAAGVTKGTVATALYLDGRGIPGPLNDIDAALDALVLSEAVTLEVLVGALG